MILLSGSVSYPGSQLSRLYCVVKNEMKLIKVLHTVFISNKLSGFSLDVSYYFVKFSLKCFLNLNTSSDNNNPN